MEVERQRFGRSGRSPNLPGDPPNQISQPLITLVDPLPIGVGKFPCQSGFERRIRRAGEYGTDSPVRDGHQQPGRHRRVDDGVANVESSGTAGKLPRGHSQFVRRPFVDSAARAIAGVIGGARYRHPASQG